ncbi:MAG: radical SAM protein [Melioribacteraceae bacterium]
MKLEEIGFYTLSDDRAMNSSATSPLWRCELILTDECNFKCPYCRGLRSDIAGELPFDSAMETLKYWVKDGLKNVRFSGGEPTLYPGLDLLIKFCKENNVENIAISTNGSADIDYYKYLIKCGVNDFSISLDSGCCSIGDKMTGGITGAWNKVVDNIRELSKITYVTVGVVFTDDNVYDAHNTVRLADSLGVSDIRVIPAAQYDKALKMLTEVSPNLINKYPILKYRANKVQNGEHVRGLGGSKNLCRLVLDDMAVAGGYHFPCIIYMREGGDPIGVVGKNMRKEREEWMYNNPPHKDKICSKMCLDVCVAFNKIAAMSK